MATEQTLEPGTDAQARQLLFALWEKIADQLCPLFLRHNVLVPELEKILRWRAARIALENPEFAIDGRSEKFRQTHSHAAVITGLTRTEIAQAEATDERPVPLDGGNLHRIVRVLTAWRTEAGYQDANGRPIDLPLRGPAPSLHQLCLRYGRDTPTRTIADVLVKNGNAEWITGDDSAGRQTRTLRFISSVARADIPSEEALLLLTQYISDFIHSLAQRFSERGKPGPRFRQAYFENIDPERLNEARERLHEEMDIANRRFAECLEKFRLDNERGGVRIGVGSYSFFHSESLLAVHEKE